VQRRAGRAASQVASPATETGLAPSTQSAAAVLSHPRVRETWCTFCPEHSISGENCATGSGHVSTSKINVILDCFLIREVPEALMLSCLRDYLRLAVHVRPLVSVPVSGDRHSVSYSPLGTARRGHQDPTFRSVVPMCVHPVPFRSVRDLGCFPACRSCSSGLPEWCSPRWLPAARPVVTTNGFQEGT